MPTTPARLLKASSRELTVASRAGKHTSLPSSQEHPHPGVESPMTAMAKTKMLPCIWKRRHRNPISCEAARKAAAIMSAVLYRDGLVMKRDSRSVLTMAVTPHESPVQDVS